VKLSHRGDQPLLEKHESTLVTHHIWHFGKESRLTRPVLQDLAGTFLNLSAFTKTRSITALAVSAVAIPTLLLGANRSVHSKFKYLVNSSHLLAATLDICSSHPMSYCLPLFWSDWSEALRFQKLNAGTFRAKI
jgi:hypothetical protein